MKKGLLLIASLVISMMSIKAQKYSDSTIVQNFMNRLASLPQEKLYVHTDRDIYTAGDTIWFRGYLVNASTLQECDFSNFIYAELKDKSDSTYVRVKIIKRDSVFSGYIPISEKLQQGEYMLRAFTSWMENDGDDFLFKKRIRVINPFDSRVFTSLRYRYEGDDRFADITFLNIENKPFEREQILYQFGENDDNLRYRIGRTNDDGVVSIKVDSAVDRIFVKFSENAPFDFSRDIWLPVDSLKYSVQFFPEGGALLADNIQNIAFKAIGTDGFSIDVEGEIYNSKDELQSYFVSMHAGMGSFPLNVVEGESYYANIRVKGSEQITRFDLPRVESQGIALALNRKYGTNQIVYSIKSANKQPLPDNLMLLVHSRGIPIICQKVTENVSGIILTDNFPEGILHVSIIDDECNILTDRLCFVRNEADKELSIATDKSKYHVRDEVKMVLTLKDLELDSVASGSFSVSVTDAAQAEKDSLSSSILSTLLLTSDLKGYVENPDFYFQNNDIKSLRLLDYLLMTQGWSRFDISKVAKGVYDTTHFFLERGQVISGQILKYSGKGATDSKLVAIASGGKYQTVDADSEGRFIVDKIPFEDSTAFIVQGMNNKGRKYVEVILDEDEYLPSKYKFPFGVRQQIKEEEFFNKHKEVFYIDEDGMKVYVLNEVVIRRTYRKKFNNFYEACADQMLDSARLAALDFLGLEQILMKIPGVWMDKQHSSIKHFNDDLLIYLDNFEFDPIFFHELETMRGDELLSVVYISPTKGWSIFGPKGKNGAIVITRNLEFVPPYKQLPSIVTFTPLGYQRNAQFYVPAYQVDEVRAALKDIPDERKTLYWNPKVVIDGSGVVDLNFTTSDKYTTFNVIVEGITKDGTPLHKEYQFETDN
ncbi:MAG: hypothetical protein J6K74_08470 [Marinifilaceae bacterium]|nr:hypothetical protein [Marinifilaceae bacterium]